MTQVTQKAAVDLTVKAAYVKSEGERGKEDDEKWKRLELDIDGPSHMKGRAEWKGILKDP